MHYTPSTIPDEAVAALQPAFEYSDVMTSEDWVSRCKSDQAQLWSVGNCWAITEVQNTKVGLVAHIVGLAGSPAEQVIDEIEEWAKALGCKKVFFSGRKGWLKARPDYKLRCVTAEKEL